MEAAAVLAHLLGISRHTQIHEVLRVLGDRLIDDGDRASGTQLSDDDVVKDPHRGVPK